MICVTGDTHGFQTPWRTCLNNVLHEGDTVIVTGDFGFGFFEGGDHPDDEFYDYLEQQPYTILFIDGNHENFAKLNSYPAEQWNGGRVHFIRKNLIHLMRGEIYKIEGKKIFCFGGGFSIDQGRRTPGKSWWPEEMPSEEEYNHASQTLGNAGWNVDYIITHTAPTNTVNYMNMRNLGVNKSVYEERRRNEYLQFVADRVKYEKWYFGHFHIDAELWKSQYALLDSVRDLCTGELIATRGGIGV